MWRFHRWHHCHKDNRILLFSVRLLTTNNTGQHSFIQSLISSSRCNTSGWVLECGPKCAWQMSPASSQKSCGPMAKGRVALVVYFKLVVCCWNRASGDASPSAVSLGPDSAQNYPCCSWSMLRLYHMMSAMPTQTITMLCSAWTSDILLAGLSGKSR